MSRRLRNTALSAALGLLALLALAGCGSSSNAGDPERGRELFAANCANCHVLAQAGSGGVAGPDLDASFEAARLAGMDENTIAGVVKRQIAHPRDADPYETAVYMPADLVIGQDAVDVATYVARVAGVPGIEPPALPGPPGAQLFADLGCAGCHTLAAAGASGVAGPDLDEVLPDLARDYILSSLTDPDADIAEGFPAGVMPPFTSLSDEELEQLIEYLIACAGDPESEACLGGHAE